MKTIAFENLIMNLLHQTSKSKLNNTTMYYAFILTLFKTKLHYTRTELCEKNAHSIYGIN